MPQKQPFWYYFACLIAMEDYKINVSKVEELQTLNDRDALDKIFERAKSAVVNGAKVLLMRKGFASSAEPFQEIDTLEDLETYRSTVFRYVK
ncbi:MAG: hypothetical protein ACO1OO_10455 [Flavisolibacter sp.]